MSRVGLILNNIGTPEAADPEAVGAYLKEFLMDKEIIGLPYILRYVLVHFVIVPHRKFTSALKYQKIWQNNKSPLLEISEHFAIQLQSELGPSFFVRLGMVNGRPSIENALREMQSNGVEKIIFAPLYPQYAKATSFASTEKVKFLIQKVYKKIPQLALLSPFYHSQIFVQKSAQKLKLDWDSGKWQHTLFSFHGLPESQIKKNEGCLKTSDCCSRPQACQMNCYRAQAIKTAEMIADAAGLTKDQYTICFQSRLGPAKWIRPASSDVVHELAKSGIKKILVQTPSFVADCLETLEEIAIELRSEFICLGGEDLKLVPCLNYDPDWVKGFAGLVRQTI